ncbi:flagellar protein FliS [Bacillus canaveralius]|uniref:Flagellar secretion chaperone FliS n=1 Tax=Bacillus canaveralius TaxID=1403243 RepID=A0A2N5GMK4_9BACI|nr:flagellar export chaperone FliS [Bacillus canaveralius]PLR83170.1 flagellar protein FliS [Bacillus canaveralius]PLR94088.1 flagellar protein FliS [Bacillus canaveralius]RSK54112.1 flagella export chaperone FliS [Bacillus canaveralius]
MLQNHYEKYQQNAVLTSSPGELTLMLYNGCLKFIHVAKKAIEDKDIETKHINISKAQNIITELIVTLNLDYSIAKEMRRLYDYINRRLIDANLKNDISILNEVEELVTDFRDTWKEVIAINRKKQFRTSGQA